jgi:hypothetical protein
MLSILPILAFAVFFVLLIMQQPHLGWRTAILRTSILWGSYLVLATEFLSLFRGLTAPGLALAWLLPLVISFALILRRARSGAAFTPPGIQIPAHWIDRSLLLGLLAILGVTGLVAWVAPPQTWDSMVYHMARVAHWAQERAVRPFATGIDVQNSMSPGAEMAILHFYVLAGGDRLANFISWFAMAGSLIGVSLIARQLGASRSGQLFAAIFAATLPMGIVQASSTMTDYVVAFWVVCAASETIGLFNRSTLRAGLVMSSLAAGLALLTKPIAAAYLAPFALFAGITLWKRTSLRRAVPWLVTAMFLVAALNAGHLARNFTLYGNPISGEERIAHHANQLLSIPGMLSNLLKNAALHTGTPKQAVNEWLYERVVDLHRLLEVDPNDPRTTSVGTYGPVGGFATHEDVVGNLIHSGVILVVTAIAILKSKLLGRLTLYYLLMTIATFFLFSLLFKWQIFGARLHMAFFVLFAPLAGHAISRLAHPTTVRLASLCLIVGSIPWLTSINSRPLISLPNRSYVRSILQEPRERLYFANYSGLRHHYAAMIGDIQDAGCSKVGIAISGSGGEYPIWVLLGAPSQELEIEWLVGGTPSERYKKVDFQPCAVICQRCPDSWDTLRGLPKVYDRARFRLYLGSP